MRNVLCISGHVPVSSDKCYAFWNQMKGINLTRDSFSSNGQCKISLLSTKRTSCCSPFISVCFCFFFSSWAFPAFLALVFDRNFYRVMVIILENELCDPSSNSRTRLFAFSFTLMLLIKALIQIVGRLGFSLGSEKVIGIIARIVTYNEKGSFYKTYKDVLTWVYR